MNPRSVMTESRQPKTIAQVPSLQVSRSAFYGVSQLLRPLYLRRNNSMVYTNTSNLTFQQSNLKYVLFFAICPLTQLRKGQPNLRISRL